MQKPLPRVGFVGLGAMGFPMANRLVANGYRVVGYDTNPSRLQGFAHQHGPESVRPVEELGPDLDILIMILPNSIVSRAVTLDTDGIAHRMRPGTLIVDMTSGVPSMTVELQARLEPLGIGLIDAPVSGAVARAENGTLTIMAGGDTQLIERARPLLESMGTIAAMGGIGAGHAMKALNNLVSCAGFLIGIEALIIGSKFGLDPTVMVDVLNNSTGMNNSTQKKFQQYVVSRQFNSGFPLKMMLKDIETALTLAQEMNVPAPFARLCLDLWSATQSLLGPDVDHTAMARGIEMLAGHEIGQKNRGNSSITT